ncbi:hypothetical protein BXY80_2810 [Ichthyenterobacterium magnum]|uniref:Uncharacterized protein n=2 Tax=Ichthyenterobacterium magnum TaxID=1230530 RepID=A0A420DAB0_9FLAO|nr:hypothetical protein BXY80_2810 [Ichthyenterobacterium magnum]
MHLRKTMKKIIIILILIFNCGLIFSQSDSLKMRQIEIKTAKLNEQSNKILEKRKFETDSIRHEAKLYANKVYVESEFQNSGTYLVSELYFENGKILFVKMAEKSPDFKNEDDAWKFTQYYYENGILILEDYYIQIPSVMMCVGIPMDKDWHELYGYNRNLTDEFLKQLTITLIEKTK